MTPNPCKRDCPQRSARCHAECTAYLEYEALNALRRDASNIQAVIRHYVRENVGKHLRAKGRYVR